MSPIVCVLSPRYAAETCSCFAQLAAKEGERISYGTHGVKEIKEGLSYQCERCGTEYHAVVNQPTVGSVGSVKPDEETRLRMEQDILSQEGGIDLFWEYLAENYHLLFQ